MVAYSTKLRLQKPTVGADADVWGGYLNTTVDSIDTLLSAITTTGSANAYVLSSGQTLAAYATGLSFLIKPNFTNTGAATINVDTLGAKNIYKNVAGTPTALAANEIYSGVPIRVTYDGTQFILTDLLDAALMAISQLAWSSGKPLQQWTAADTVSLTLTPDVTSISLGAGSAGTPSIQMGGDTTTGFYRNAANQVSLSISGVVKWTWSGNNLSSGTSGGLYLGNGSAAFPTCSFVSDSTSGLYRIGSNNLGAAINGVATWDWNATRLLMVSGFDLQRATDVTAPSQASVGYMGLGDQPEKTANYTFVAADSGKAIDHNSASAHSFTHNTGIIGKRHFVSGYNAGAGVLTIARGAGVTYRDAVGTNADLTVAQYKRYSVVGTDTAETFSVRVY